MQYFWARRLAHGGNSRNISWVCLRTITTLVLDFVVFIICTYLSLYIDTYIHIYTFVVIIGLQLLMNPTGSRGGAGAVGFPKNMGILWLSSFHVKVQMQVIPG